LKGSISEIFILPFYFIVKAKTGRDFEGKKTTNFDGMILDAPF